MLAFIIALAVLVGGYFVYGTFVDKIMGTSKSTPMPAYTKQDGVDYIPIPTWRAFLIQFLNIAGLGPIFGAIMGVMYGPAAFLWIVFGTIFAGAVHDFLSGVISIRMGGASLPEIVGKELGNSIKQVMRLFSVLLLMLVAAVFVVTPAGLLSDMTPAWMNQGFWICAIFGYYLLATLLPIDRLIGRLYPLFGLSLLFMALALLYVIVFEGKPLPIDFSGGLSTHFSGNAASTHPVWPMMFVSIACGAISGFHATQSPMIARCLKNETLARPIFYGAMVAEGIVALIWAAAAIAYTGGYGELEAYMAAHGNNAGALVHDLSFDWLGTAGGNTCNTRSCCRSYHYRRHRTAERPTYGGRCHRMESAQIVIASSHHRSALCHCSNHHDDRFQRAVAILRMVQPNPLSVYSMGRYSISGAAWQALYCVTCPGTVYDCGMHHICILCTAS